MIELTSIVKDQVFGPQVFASTDLHCHILSYNDSLSLFSAELVNKEWNLHAKNPASATCLNFKHCFRFEKNNDFMSALRYYFSYPKEYNVTDIQNQEYIPSVKRFCQANTLIMDLSGSLDDALKSMKFSEIQILHRKKQQQKLLSEIASTMRKLNTIKVDFDINQTPYECFDLIKQILINQDHIKHVQLGSSAWAKNLIFLSQYTNYFDNLELSELYDNTCIEKFIKIQSVVHGMNYSNKLIKIDLRSLILVTPMHFGSLSNLKVLRLIDIMYYEMAFWKNLSSSCTGYSRSFTNLFEFVLIAIPCSKAIAQSIDPNPNYYIEDRDTYDQLLCEHVEKVAQHLVNLETCVVYTHNNTVISCIIHNVRKCQSKNCSLANTGLKYLECIYLKRAFKNLKQLKQSFGCQSFGFGFNNLKCLIIGIKWTFDFNDTALLFFQMLEECRSKVETCNDIKLFIKLVCGIHFSNLSIGDDDVKAICRILKVWFFYGLIDFHIFGDPINDTNHMMETWRCCFRQIHNQCMKEPVKAIVEARVFKDCQTNEKCDKASLFVSNDGHNWFTGYNLMLQNAVLLEPVGPNIVQSSMT